LGLSRQSIHTASEERSTPQLTKDFLNTIPACFCALWILERESYVLVTHAFYLNNGVFIPF
jgi:hypothetical protein